MIRNEVAAHYTAASDQDSAGRNNGRQPVHAEGVDVRHRLIACYRKLLWLITLNELLLNIIIVGRNRGKHERQEANCGKQTEQP